MELYIHSPNTTSWRGTQLRKGTGTNLPLPLLAYLGGPKARDHCEDLGVGRRITLR
jgi:hypothetical protein